jgi:hypothetical protein
MLDPPSKTDPPQPSLEVREGCGGSTSPPQPSREVREGCGGSVLGGGSSIVPYPSGNTSGVPLTLRVTPQVYPLPSGFKSVRKKKSPRLGNYDWGYAPRLGHLTACPGPGPLSSDLHRRGRFAVPSRTTTWEKSSRSSSWDSASPMPTMRFTNPGFTKRVVLPVSG